MNKLCTKNIIQLRQIEIEVPNFGHFDNESFLQDNVFCNRS